jgi:outer membrane protein assembly factor BamB
MPTRSRTSVLALLLALIPAGRADDWPQFRGPNCSGRAADGLPLPAAIGPDKNVVWKAELPPGHSSPVVVGDRVYVTAVRDKKLLTMALDRRTGKALWEAEAPCQALEKVHQIGSHAQPTPAADAERVVSFFGSCGLFCYDRGGKLLWRRPLGPFKNDFGAGSSPVLIGDRVLLCQDHDQGSFLACYDKRTGAVVWQTDRSEFLRGYCTPVLWEADGKPQVVVAGTLRVAAYDLATGKEVWTVRGIARTICATPVIGDGLLYVSGWAAGGDAEARIVVEPFDEALKKYDKNHNGKLERDELTEGPIAERFSQVDLDKDGSITREEYERFRELFARGRNVVVAIRPGGKGDVTETHVAWRNARQVPFCASPLFAAGCVFTVKDGGFLSSLSARDGTLLKRDRLPGPGNYYGSPVVGDGKVYLLSQRGRLTVVSAAAEWQVLATADFGEDVYATPAITGGQIFLRTAGRLYCFGTGGQK